MVADEAAPRTHQVQDSGYTAAAAPAPCTGAQKTVGSQPCPLIGGLCRLQVLWLATRVAPAPYWLTTRAYSPKTEGAGSG